MLVAKAIAASASAAKVYVEDVFSTWLYTGNGSTQTITNEIDLSGKGGLVWMKSRNSVYSHSLFDTERGAGSILYSNSTAAQGTGFGQTFTGTGFTFTNGGSSYNSNTEPYASWTFRKAAKFFDVVTYTGDDVVGRTVSHNLGSAPGCMIIKRTDATGGWIVYHRSLGAGNIILLNSTGTSSALGADYWNNTAPTSTVFTLGGGGAAPAVNASGGTYVAYLFAHDAGGFGDSGNDSVVSCGSFAANNPTTVTLGWEPQFMLFKPTTTAGNWYIYDAMRGMTTGAGQELYPNTTDAEGTRAAGYITPTPTGFTAKIPDSGNTYIYIAIRRGPMKTPTDATKVFSAITVSTNDSTGGTTNFPVDLLWELPRAGGNHRYAFTRLLGAGNYLKPSSTDLENAGGSLSLASNTSFTGPNLGITSNIVYDAFRRAPGFLDVVAYTGTGSLPGVTHNLKATPELKIIKRRSSTSDWVVGGSVLGESAYLYLNTTDAKVTSSNYWDGGDDSSTVFSVRNTNAASDASGSTYIAYLFATCPGVSKVGSYTGTGTTLQINCGFTAGARFVLIKRTDSTGDWYVWDSARGIVAGNDPYLLLNSTAAEVTNTDYVDTYSLGFELSSTAPAAINANGGSYIFLAIA